MSFPHQLLPQNSKTMRSVTYFSYCGIYDSSGGIPFSVGNFGKIPYGVHMIGAITMANPQDACDSIKEFRAGEFSFDQNVIAIVRAGGCPFTTKTRNAQAAGAKVVVIVQDKEEPLPASFGVASDSIFLSDFLIKTLFQLKDLLFLLFLSERRTVKTSSSLLKNFLSLLLTLKISSLLLA